MFEDADRVDPGGLRASTSTGSSSCARTAAAGAAQPSASRRTAAEVASEPAGGTEAAPRVTASAEPAQAVSDKDAAQRRRARAAAGKKYKKCHGAVVEPPFPHPEKLAARLWPQMSESTEAPAEAP